MKSLKKRATMLNRMLNVFDCHKKWLMKLDFSGPSAIPMCTKYPNKRDNKRIYGSALEQTHHC